MTLVQLRGQVVYVCCFDASHKEAPSDMAYLEELHRKYSPYGLTVLGVAKSNKLTWNPKSEGPEFNPNTSLQDEVAMFQQFRVHHALTIGIALTPTSRFQDHFHYDDVPLHIVIDRSGMIRVVESGPTSEIRDRLRQSIELICSE
jgi:hypothetical protein